MRVFYPESDTAGLVHALRQRLPALARELPLRLVILFGSYAKGNYTVASDVDLLVVYAGARRQNDYAVIKRVLDIRRLEPHIYTEEEYGGMPESVLRMAAEGIVLLAAGGDDSAS